MDGKSGKISKQSDSYPLNASETMVILDTGSTGKQFFAGLTRKDKTDNAFLGTLFFDPISGKLELNNTKMGMAGIAPGRLPKLEKPNIPKMNYQTQPGFISGDRYIAVFYGNNPMTAGVLGVHWDRNTGKFLEVKELYVNRNGNALGSVAAVAGGRFISHAPLNGKGAFYSAETGKKLTVVPINTQFGFLANTVVLGIERPAGAKTATLHAFNMTADKLLWSQPCHELTGR